MAGFGALVEEGRTRHWGVSNFDVDDMEELLGVRHGDRCAANQVYYALTQRGIEVALLPWLRGRNIACMAYSPLDQGRLGGDSVLKAMGKRHDASANQVALAWVLHQPGVIAIPKAVRDAHLRENLAAADLALSAAELAELDRRFPPPQRKTPLAMT